MKRFWAFYFPSLFSAFVGKVTEFHFSPRASICHGDTSTHSPLTSLAFWQSRMSYLGSSMAKRNTHQASSSAGRPFVWSYHRSVLWISSSWWSPRCSSSSWLLGFPGHGWLTECQRLSGTNLTLKFKFAFSCCHKEYHFSFEYGPSCPPCLCMSPFECVGVWGCEHTLVHVYAPGLGGPPGVLFLPRECLPCILRHSFSLGPSAHWLG